MFKTPAVHAACRPLWAAVKSVEQSWEVDLKRLLHYQLLILIDMELMTKIFSCVRYWISLSLRSSGASVMIHWCNHLQRLSYSSLTYSKSSSSKEFSPVCWSDLKITTSILANNLASIRLAHPSTDLLHSFVNKTVDFCLSQIGSK